MLTKSGAYIIFDISDPAHLPGRRIPVEFQRESDRTGGGTWFFQPAHWSAENGWGGIAIAEMRGYPFNYSPAYTDPALALADAEMWEATQEARDKRDAANLAFLNNTTIHLGGA